MGINSRRAAPGECPRDTPHADGLCLGRTYAFTIVIRPLHRWINICGRSPQSCTPVYELRSSVAGIIQFPYGDPGPCTGVACTDWDSLQPAFCTSDCVPVADAPGIRTALLDPANLRTGGLVITWEQLPLSSATPEFPSVFRCAAVEPRQLETVRTIVLLLACDPTSDDPSALSIVDLIEDPTCVYTLVGISPAACGRPAPVAPNASYSFSSSATASLTPSRTPSPSVSASSTATVTGSATGAETVTPSASVAPSTTPLPRDPGYAFVSSLDRDAGVAAAGVVVGVSLSLAVVFAPSLKRAMLPRLRRAQQRRHRDAAAAAPADGAAVADRGVAAGITASLSRSLAVSALLLTVVRAAAVPLTVGGSPIPALGNPVVTVGDGVGVCDGHAADINCIFDASGTGNTIYHFDLRGLCSPNGFVRAAGQPVGAGLVDRCARTALRPSHRLSPTSRTDTT